ncbi:NADH dehydrogenase subunit 4 [Melampsora americana]|nr:NADH dehydrogenase subunit 4 [Melampsora americana]
MLSIISILEGLLLIVPALLSVAYVTIAERKTMASMQRRLGPNSVALITSIINLVISLIMFILFDFSSKFQFIEEHYQISYFDIYLGVDETLLLAVFLVLDIIIYIFFESILPPLFLLIGLFGSSNKVRASFYLFLYTLLVMSSIMANFSYVTQLFLFMYYISGIVLKLSLYGIFRLILPLLPKASLNYTYIIYVIGVITIIYASFSTLRTIDIKELIAYSSVSHAAVYLIGAFSNTVQGIEGAIVLGLAHGNSGTPNIKFIGEFMSLYGAFERMPILGILATFGGSYSVYFVENIGDVTRREFIMLLVFVVLTVLFGIYPAPILDGLHYSVTSLIYSIIKNYNILIYINNINYVYSY